MRVPGIPYVQGRNDYTDGDNRKFGFAIHNTSNDASDTGEASYATRRTDGTSSHFYTDADSVTQSIDTDDKTGHAGSSTGNENAISVEITGANGKTRAWWLANVAWEKLAAVLATVIKHHWPDGSFQIRRASVAEMKANPRVKAFYGHNDMRLAWGGTTHTDPGPNFPWDRLLAAVSAAMEEDDMFTDEDRKRLNNINTALLFGGPSCGPAVEDANLVNGDAAAPYGAVAKQYKNGVISQLAQVRADQAPGAVDVAAVKAALLDPEVLAAIAKAVADEDHARSAG
jgi:N-acetyl-anhydromuramyl-L-alanine amidase AmpD